MESHNKRIRVNKSTYAKPAGKRHRAYVLKRKEVPESKNNNEDDSENEELDLESELSVSGKIIFEDREVSVQQLLNKVINTGLPYAAKERYRRVMANSATGNHFWSKSDKLLDSEAVSSTHPLATVVDVPKKGKLIRKPCLLQPLRFKRSA